jgi:hypothetical protein
VCGDRQASEDTIGRLFEGPAQAGRRGVALYARGLRLKTASRLQAALPQTAALLGPEAFGEAVGACWRQEADERRGVRQLLRSLPEFLRRLGGAAARPPAADLAELEVAIGDVDRELSMPVSSPEALVDAATRGLLPGARLTLVPAVRVLEIGSHAARLWRSLTAARRAPEAKKARISFVIVWRRDRRVFHRVVPASEGRALRAAQQGATLAEVCGLFAGRRDPGRAAREALQGWFEDGLVSSLVPAGTNPLLTSACSSENGAAPRFGEQGTWPIPPEGHMARIPRPALRPPSPPHLRSRPARSSDGATASSASWPAAAWARFTRPRTPSSPPASR